MLRPCLMLFALFSLITGVLYPVMVTVIAQVVFPHQANGSLVHNGDRVVGSELIGQPFSEARWFWSRPSATGPMPYNGAASSGSNLGPTNPALTAAVSERIAALRAADPKLDGPIPADLVTTSGSGLDPHLSPAAAHIQVRRVATARGIDPAVIDALVRRHIEPRQFGILGEPRVNVLALNLELDKLSAEQR